MFETRDIFISTMRKVIYICQYMSASQYKSGENANKYVHVVSSWLQLIYILWVFNVIILSICHKFIDSSISGGLIPCNLFYCLQGNNHDRVGPRGTKFHWINPYQFILAVWKAIISRELVKGTLSSIGLFPIDLFCMYGKKLYINRVGPRYTKSHWVNS